jgi:molybdopterin-containing oxidoreductase family iron-sulfur binding subunit
MKLAPGKTETEIAESIQPGSGRKLWRSIDELAGDDSFIAALRREFPEYANRLNDGATRRQFLQLMAASLTLAGAQGCVEQPQENIVPFVQAPEHLIPGKPLYYATAMSHDGAGIGLLVESRMGRPVKIEGNPLHPAVPEIMAAAPAAGRIRFGATDAFSQASILSLYDPDRSQTVLRDGQIDSWESLAAELQTRLNEARQNGGRGLRLLTGTVVSPTLAEQLQQFLEHYPNAQWHQFEPIHHDNEILGGRLAFGNDVTASYRVERADVILSLDSDFLADGPMHLRYARGFADRRRVDPGAAGNGPAMNRLYVVESSSTITGAAADHRLPLSPDGVAVFAMRIAAALGLQVEGAANIQIAGAEIPSDWLDAVTEDLQRARGRSLVVAGRSQPPVVHALAHWMNATLGNAGQTVEYREPNIARPEVQTESLEQLVDAMRNKEVETLVILGGNPVYDAPANFSFAAALANVAFRLHLSPYVNETSAQCHWHVPELHFLESWSDTRASDGTATIVQPLIAPLYEGKSVHEVVQAMLLMPPADGHEIVRAHWQRWHAAAGGSGEFEAFWQTALHNGVVAGTELPIVEPNIGGDFAVTPVADAPGSLVDVLGAAPLAEGALYVVFQPDRAVWDGRFANNGWLQELPRPLTSLTWDNAAHLAPSTAESLQLKSGDVVEISVAQSSIQIPVLIVPGHPANVVTLQLGYGREQAGRVGNDVGTNAYPLRLSGAMWHAGVTDFRATGESRTLATTQHHHLLDGRNLVRAGTAAALAENPEHPAFMSSGHQLESAHAPADTSMYPPWPYTGYKWGMVINQSACIGCNACVVACQAENNIPIVGKDQVVRGREMHWLRIDHYFEGGAENPVHYLQPMLCQHCELAPCEPVCPVAATTHSSEGLNEMTYNRCVGTRYCSNNCPYKVRRFNFLDYNQELRQDATLQLLPNPEVTVRSRGVMEKCTFCVQRINAARIDAEKQGRSIRDGEVITACQAACPTEAIVFGDLNDADSRVNQLATSPLNYSVLGELNTRPRTTYLAIVRNPHPALVQSAETPHVD